MEMAMVTGIEMKAEVMQMHYLCPLPLMIESQDDVQTDFGGNQSENVADPAVAINMGSYYSGRGVGFMDPIPFTGNAATMSERVYLPAEGIPVWLTL